MLENRFVVKWYEACKRNWTLILEEFFYTHQESLVCHEVCGITWRALTHMALWYSDDAKCCANKGTIKCALQTHVRLHRSILTEYAAFSYVLYLPLWWWWEAYLTNKYVKSSTTICPNKRGWMNTILQFTTTKFKAMAETMLWTSIFKDIWGG
jgi:hypothetical protein